MDTAQRTRAGVSGLIGVGVALGAGELLAGIFSAVPSPLASVGGLIVDSAPPFLEDFAISLFGTADKAALAIGTTIIALALGWFVGIQAVKRTWVAPLMFGGFGVLGAAAAMNEPFAELIPVLAATAVAAVAGWMSLEGLVSVAGAEEPTDGLAGDHDRRRFIALAAGTGVAAVAAGATGRMLLNRLADVPDIDVAGESVLSDAALAEYSLDVPGIAPIVVPNDDFYRIDTALVVPSVDEQNWSMRVHGMVDEEVVLTFDDLQEMEQVEKYVTIACVSNEVGGGLVGNALWTGPRLTDVLDMAGVQPGAGQIVGRAVDGFTVGFPTEAAYDGREPLVAIGMNGEALPRRHGFPARLIVPGLYGYVSATKWLSDIELTTWDGFDAYWVPRGWAKEAPIKTQSRIDTPNPGRTLEAGSTAFGGVAWAPLRGISRVELRVDGGEWIEAELSTPLADTAWVQWRAVADLGSGNHVVEVRATDGDGKTQTAEEQSPRPDGATGYHTLEYRVS